MATAAVGAEFTIVDVICPMTVTAVAGGAFDLVQRHAVTIVATHVDVRPVKREVRLQIVIEGPDIPCHGVVAGLAAVLEVPLVRIVVAMAAHAAGIFVRVCLRRMTALALLLGVHAVQRESCQIVIEKHRVLPVHFRMTVLALLAEQAFMRIVVEMAGVAAGHQLNVKNRFNMTIVTSDLPVPAEQLVVRVDIMIKERLFPRRADMAGVTLVAAMLVMRVVIKMA